MASIKLNQDGQWKILADDSNVVKHSPQDLTSVQQSQARNNIGVFTQPTQPAAANEGDIWFDTSKNFMDTVYPVGSIYMSVNSTSPAALFGGSWEAIQGRFLIGKDNGQFISAGAMGGEAYTTLTVNQIPSHNGHISGLGYGNVKAYLSTSTLTSYNYARGWNSPSGGEVLPATMSTGGGQPHSNLPPYLVVYMWKRTA